MSIHDSPGGALGSAWFGLARLDPESTETETQLARSGSIDSIPPRNSQVPNIGRDRVKLSSAQLNSHHELAVQDPVAYRSINHIRFRWVPTLKRLFCWTSSDTEQRNATQAQDIAMYGKSQSRLIR